MAYPFTNLVFEGGGVKGVAYGGVLEVLDQQGILNQIQNVAGTSAGAIIATMVALGYSAGYIKDKMLNLDFKTFKDGNIISDFERFITQYGWYKGQVFLEFMQGEVEGALGSKDATFTDLNNKRLEESDKYRELFVVGTNLSERTDRVFSYATTPDIAIADAVRISMSYPLFFASRKLDGDVYVDGGVLRNYPLDLFDELTQDTANPGVRLRIPNPNTLGFNLGKNMLQAHPITDLDQYAGNLFESILAVQDVALMDNADDVKRTVFINTLGIQTTDFDITMQQKEDLVQKGHEATANYLRDNYPGEPAQVELT
ncbi:MAG TPA: patatin-like phospholipase family protein [Blastocatellia bacterium]|nr:patatin-like phospholipase family protein [Blastocatellia bacterium]